MSVLRYGYPASLLGNHDRQRITDLADAQRVAERIDIVLDILVAGDYHSAVHNLEILKAELLRQVAESTPDIPKAPWEI